MTIDSLHFQARRQPRLKTVFSDEALDYWGQFYLDNNLRARNVLFETFMQAPEEIARALLFKPAGWPITEADFLPPLARQRLAAARLHGSEMLQAVRHAQTA